MIPGKEIHGVLLCFLKMKKKKESSICKLFFEASTEGSAVRGQTGYTVRLKSKPKHHTKTAAGS